MTAIAILHPTNLRGKELRETIEARHRNWTDLRLLSTHWIHDPATGALFTSDTFSHTWRDSPEPATVLNPQYVAAIGTSESSTK